MGHSREEKSKSHQRIVEIAAARMRESGTDGPGVAEIMREAGLTHGGFYKHFESRDQLVAEAVELAFAQGHERYEAATKGAADPLAAFVDMYASQAHCDNAAEGCGVVSFGGDAARAPGPVRAAYSERVEGYIAELQAVLAGDGGDIDGGDIDGGDIEARRRAVVSVSALVGAVLMARAVDDDALSAEILAEVAGAVKAQTIGA